MRIYEHHTNESGEINKGPGQIMCRGWWIFGLGKAKIHVTCLLFLLYGSWKNHNKDNTDNDIHKLKSGKISQKFGGRLS